MGGKLEVLRVDNLNVHEGIRFPVLMHGIDIMVLREKEKSRIQVEQMVG